MEDLNLTIETSRERKRGCGFRRSSPDGVGLYLMGDGIMEVCERLPFPLRVCPTCGEGIKFSRGYTWILPGQLFNNTAEPRCNMAEMPFRSHDPHFHASCYMCRPPDDKHGLMWVGEKFYTPEDFVREAEGMGISKRIAALPQGFEVGKHIVYLAHKKAIPGNAGSKPVAGVFYVFKPSRVDLVVDTTDPAALPERAITLAKKLGDKARLVKVEPVEAQPTMYPESQEVVIQ